MGILSTILLAPLAPVRGVIALGEVIGRHAEEQLHNPANVRRRLEELEEARERGEITAAEEEQAQTEILEATLLKPTMPGSGSPAEGG